MSKPLDWLAKKHEDELPPELDKAAEKKGVKSIGNEDIPKKARKKTPTDIGSRWIAPILLGLTILISLILKIFSHF